MPPLATRPVPLRPPLSRPRRLLRVTIAAVACLHAAWASELRAQSGLSHTDDAIPIPGGWFRFSVGNAWTRYESRFGENGAIRALGEDLSTDSLGARQLPLLAPIEGALQTLTKDPAQRLTFGRLDVRSDARIVTTPFALEYGITRRLTFGVMIPLVQTRRSAQVRVNQRATGDTTKTSNVGVLAATDRQAQATLNAKLVADLTKAAASLTALLTRCAQNSAAAECNPIRGREADASDAAKRATDFASAVVSAYGITEATAVIAPLQGSALATSIESQRAALQTKLASYVPGTVIGTLPTATTEFSYVDLQGQFGSPGLLKGPYGGGLDSIATTDRIGVGDIELRARVLLLDHSQRDSLPMRGIAYRLAVGGIVRFATSRPDSATDLLDIGTGDGAGAEVRTALDLSTGRVGATIAGRFAKSFARTQKIALLGNPSGGFPYPVFGEVSRTAGDVVGLDVIPRYFISDWLAFEGEYGFERTGAATISGGTESPCSSCIALANSVLPTEVTVQRAGAGVRYSTVDAFLRGRARYPIEVSYRHLETITGDAGAPKLFRDQIQLRIYYRIRR